MRNMRARVRGLEFIKELGEGTDKVEQRKEFDELWPFQDHEELD
jgi:hypothetical protein